MNTEICPDCGKTYGIGEWYRCPHGFGTNSVVDDTIIGGEVNENVGPEPVTFYSKSEKRKYLRDHGLQEFVRHMPRPDGKRPNTVRWI